MRPRLHLIASLVAVVSHCAFAQQPFPGKCVNHSLRANVTQDGEPVIAAFVIDDITQLLIRVVGPSLSGFGISNALAEPAATLYIGTQAIALQPWGELQEAAKNTYRMVGSRVGAFPLQEDSRDLVAYIGMLGRGSYSIAVSSKRGSGAVLVEVYLVPATFAAAERANKAPEPTSWAVTPRADARVAPAHAVAHL